MDNRSFFRHWPGVCPPVCPPRFRLILTARRTDRLEALAAELTAKYITFCRILPADLEQENEILAYVDETYTSQQAQALQSKLEAH